MGVEEGRAELDGPDDGAGRDANVEEERVETGEPDDSAGANLDTIERETITATPGETVSSTRLEQPAAPETGDAEDSRARGELQQEAIVQETGEAEAGIIQRDLEAVWGIEGAAARQVLGRLERKHRFEESDNSRGTRRRAFEIWTIDADKSEFQVMLVSED